MAVAMAVAASVFMSRGGSCATHFADCTRATLTSSPIELTRARQPLGPTVTATGHGYDPGPGHGHGHGFGYGYGISPRLMHKPPRHRQHAIQQLVDPRPS